MKKDGREIGRGTREHRGWPDGDDAVAAELRRALDEAPQRVPDDMTLRRGWAAIDTRPSARARARRGFWFAGGMATTAALALACAAWLWPRRRADARARARQAGPRSRRTRARHRRRRAG